MLSKFRIVETKQRLEILESGEMNKNYRKTLYIFAIINIVIYKII